MSELNTYKLVYALITVTEDGPTDFTIDLSGANTTEDVGWNLSAASVKAFADDYPNARFVIGVRND